MLIQVNYHCRINGKDFVVILLKKLEIECMLLEVMSLIQHLKIYT